MDKKTYSLFLIEDYYKDFQKQCREKLTTVSREINLFMRDRVKGGTDADKTV